MAPTNGTRHTNGFEPPPSSMLATHVRQGNGVPHLNQDSFAQLLDESLGKDEHGEPNLNDDADLNHKLILVVTQVGLDPILMRERSNPFRSGHTSGRSISQLGQCLDVLHLAISRSRHVLFKSLDSDMTPENDVPLYVYLIPKVLSIVSQVDEAEIKKRVSAVISIAIGADSNHSSTVEVLFSFLRLCLTGLLNAALKGQCISLKDEVLIESQDFWQEQNRTDPLNPSNHFSIYELGQLLSASSFLSVQLSCLAMSKQSLIQIKKQSARLEVLIDDLQQDNETVPNVESLKAEMGSLRLMPFSTFSVAQNLNIHQEWPDSDRARKRIRLSLENKTDAIEAASISQILTQLTKALTGQAVSNLDGLSVTILTRFKTLDEDEQCTILERIGYATCQVYADTAETLTACSVCDDGCPMKDSPNNAHYYDELMRTLIALRPIVQRRSRTRLPALSALRRILLHTTTTEQLRLKGSVSGEWCLQSLRTSSRDMKIVAARALQGFLRSGAGKDTTVIRENRIVALEYLQAMWAEADLSSQEAVIIALVQMAQVVEEEELNFILSRLVDYLGHRNTYLAGVVYTELQQLAQHLQGNVAALLRPYWSTLSVVVVKNFNKRPEIVQQLSDLMGVQVEGLLQIIEEHALPYLVLQRERKLIERIGASGSSPMTPFDVCTKEINFPRILSILLSQSFPEPEQAIMTLLAHLSNDFREQDLAGWLNLHPTQTACELLKMIGDAGQGKVSKPHQGLQLLAQLVNRKSGHSSGSKRTDHVAGFLESHALAIAIYFINKVNEAAVREPNIAKRRCLTALGEFVKLGKSRVRFALPQISACLRAAMEEQSLCNAAFSAWIAMVTSLGEDEIRDLLSQTFAIIVRNWDKLDTRRQEHAYNLVAALLKEHNTLVRDLSSELPSFASIPAMSQFENEIATLKLNKDERFQITAFVQRLEDENATVVEQALHELIPILRQKHDFVHKSILREQTEPFIKDLTRAILDTCTKFDSNANLVSLSGQCLGAIGCLDPSKAESIREKKTFVVTSNFVKAEETTAFLMFFMEQVLVKEYVSTSNLREKGFLAWSLQQLLAFCDLPPDIATRSRAGGLSTKDKHWFDLSDTTRLVLTPFLTSRFVSAGKRQKANITYPFYKPGMPYKHWLTEVTLDFLNRGSGANVDMIFDVCCRLVVWAQGTSISSFLLPYVALNLLLSGIEKDKQDLMKEISCVLKQSLTGLDNEKQDHVRQCSQSVFDILDYMSLWVQETRKGINSSRVRAERGIKDPFLERDTDRIELIVPTMASISPKVITQRAIECKSYARALFHQEQFIRSQNEPSDSDYRRLQDIYAQIDEPDGIEGISAQMKFLDVESEVMEHKKAGRWNTAQSWYEMQLMEQPNNVDVQMNLLKCLKESGQHDVLIHHFDGIASKTSESTSALLPFAVEASWVTDRWDKMSEYLTQAPNGDFATGLGMVMLALKQETTDLAAQKTEDLFRSTAAELTINSTSSFQTCHDSLLKLHILDDIRIMIQTVPEDRSEALGNLNKRLSILGSYVADKQYLLGVQRAIMGLRPTVFKNDDIAGSWLTSARLARKAHATNQAYNAVLRASVLGEKSSAIEQAKLMWQEGHHRKAIQTLDGAIESGVLVSHTYRADADSVTTCAGPEDRNDMTARAFVLLGKWLDQAGQTQSDTIIKTFRKSTEQNRRWEKGWYNLGRHYNKILESEKLKPPGRESQTFLTGEIAKLVIDNFLRALSSGTKYMFQTLPKVLTLWLELVASSTLEHDARRGNSQFHAHNATQRKKVIEDTNASIKKYIERIPNHALYTILPQLVARICHPDQTVNNILQTLIIKVVKSFPQQALWTVLATAKSSSKDRATRGLGLLRKSVDNAKKDLKAFNLSEMREFINAGQKFADELLRIADFEIQGRMSKISLARDFGFNHKIAPSKLVVPCEACLIPNIPANNESSSAKTFRAFAKEPVTISAFLDEARVLPSLQKPRRLSLRGSDGRIYSVLAKPHDDLRKDQRLLEFDTMINRFLKRDISASKRRLHIRTYAVVPLNEECGLIEWVDGLKTMRDIILDLYRQSGIHADYAAVREQLDSICARSENKAKDYIDRVQSKFPPVLRHWFVETFPDPTTWFNARLRYTRSSAVMSMVGHVLGLGDRHGENILFEQGTGGVLHVDFNCLFDKGLTFEKPEMVPFRLTHNMIDAFGPYKVDGPFRRSCEITLQLLRNNEDALMTILETFLHDPTTDFMTAGKKRKPTATYVTGEVPDTPERMLEGVKGKVRGMLAGESVPLSVGGYVEEMIQRAKDEANLARMYIGWCAFL